MQPSEYIADIKFSMAYFVPELMLFSLFIALILVGIISRKYSNWTVPFVFALGLVATLIATIFQFQAELNLDLFSLVLKITKKAVFFKVLFIISGILTFVIRQLSDKKEKPSEFYALVTSIILGSHLIVMASDFIVVFISLEIISLASYVLVALPHEKRNAEASLKYLLYGMFASAIMLYGISLLYGFTASINFTTLDFYNKLANTPPVAVSLAVCMVLAGILFKISSFPFHFWVADVYESTPLSTLAFFSTCSKIAGFGLLLNFMPVIWEFDFKSYVEWFSPEYMIGACAIATIAIGNLMALGQKNIKRMLAYSTIAHSGFMLLPLTSFEVQANESVMYYMTTYVFITFSAFLLVDKLIHLSNSENLESFSGLGYSYPALGVMVIVSMIALTGLPPTTGFIAKFYIFSALWDSYTLEQEQLFVNLLLFGLANTVIGLFYYLKLPYYMFIKKNTDISKSTISTLYYISTSILSLLLVLFFIKPEWLKF